LIAVAGILGLGVLASAIFVFTLAGTFNSKRHTIADAFPETGRPKALTGQVAAAVNILMIGTDVDRPVTEVEQQLVGKAQADALMLVHVPADRRGAYVMSIPRKSVVDVAGHGRRPISTAFALGGPRLTVQTVEDLLDVRIDHVVDVSMAGLRGLTDALGGVTVDNRTAFSAGAQDFPSGRQKLSGAQVSLYVTGGSDAQQLDAQEAYFHAVLDEILSANTLLNPATISTVVSLISPYLSVDPGFDAQYVGQLGFSLRDLQKSDVHFFRLPSSGVVDSNGVQAVALDATGVADVRDHLRSDTLGALVG
jgi:LCP family protein required for cell wall assembly